MEKESFENKDVAEIMNEHFVNIKVDREERPDVDRMYMAFLQATSNNCGWPMSIFLTPTLEPLTGGTYFPIESKGLGILTFPELLIRMSNKWKTDRKALVTSGRRIKLCAVYLNHLLSKIRSGLIILTLIILQTKWIRIGVIKSIFENIWTLIQAETTTFLYEVL